MRSTDKMAVPPAYADLGKSAKDIFNKGYGNWKRDKRLFYKCVFFAPQRIGGCLKRAIKPRTSILTLVLLTGFGLVKLDVKTKSSSGVVS